MYLRNDGWKPIEKAGLFVSGRKMTAKASNHTRNVTKDVILKQ